MTSIGRSLPLGCRVAVRGDALAPAFRALTGTNEAEDGLEVRLNQIKGGREESINNVKAKPAMLWGKRDLPHERA